MRFFFQDYTKSTRTSSDHDNTHVKFQKDQHKPVEGVTHTMYLLSAYFDRI